MVDYDREDLVSGRIRWAELTPPDWRDKNNARIEQQKSSGRFEPFEKEYTRKDGSRVPVLIGGATFEEGGNQGVAFVLDLTERKCAEQALVRSEAYLAETQKLTHTGSWAWDARSQKVLYCSEEMFRIYGLDPQAGFADPQKLSATSSSGGSQQGRRKICEGGQRKSRQLRRV